MSFSAKKVLTFFLIFNENLCCGNSLEVPHYGTFDEYSQYIYIFLIRNKKIIMRILPLIWSYDKCITPNKVFFSSKKYWYLFLHDNKCCGYSSEVPQRVISDEYPQNMFSWRHKKQIVCIPLLSGAMTNGTILIFFILNINLSKSVKFTVKPENQSIIMKDRWATMP